jgi:Tfp pilus assembly protein FimV
MKFLFTRIILLSLLVILSGCFRQAGESLEPITNPTSEPLQGNPIDNNPQDALTSFPTTPTFPPVTVIQAPASDTPFVEATKALAGQPNPDATNPITGPTPTAGFITPGGPVGPVVIDTATPPPLVSATATPSGLTTPTALFLGEADPCAYTVKSGDNLFRIAVNNNVSLDDLRAANPDVFGDLIQPGQVLRIPNCVAERRPFQARRPARSPEGGASGRSDRTGRGPFAGDCPAVRR